MAVVIDQVALTTDSSTRAGATQEAPPATAPMTEDDFRFYYGPIIRTILREELERAIRTKAD